MWIVNYLFTILNVDITTCKENIKKTKPKIEGKIVGGVAVDIERYPSSAIVFNRGALCGGTILTSWAVLTAAHCFEFNDDVYDITIHVGARHKFDSKSQVHYASYLDRHENYDKAMRFACDVALLFVETPFQFSNRVQRAIVVDNDKWMTKGTVNFTVTGWGMIKYNGPISSVGLLMTQLKYVPRDECSDIHEEAFTEDMFCLYGDGERDTCKGDSGGGVLWNGYKPVVVDHTTVTKNMITNQLIAKLRQSYNERYIVGIVSHGDGCAKKNKPSVYANVYYFRKWISDSINKYYTANCKKIKKAMFKRTIPSTNISKAFRRRLR